MLTVVPMMQRHTKAVQCSLNNQFQLFADEFPIIYKSKDVPFEMNVAEQFSIEFLWVSSPSVFLPPRPCFSLHGISPVPTSHEMAAVYCHVVLNDRFRFTDFAVVHGAEISKNFSTKYLASWIEFSALTSQRNVEQHYPT